MKLILFRGFNPLAWLVLLTMVLATARPAQATHLLGGEMTYRYLDANGPASAPHRYELTLTVYNTCGAAAIRPTATIGIYEQATGNMVPLTTANYATISYGSLIVPQTSIDACTTPYVPPGCTILGASQSYQLQKFIGIVSLPATTSGYYALWTDGNRNVGITNITNPSDDEFMTLYATLAPPTRANSSPVFVDKAVANLCINDTTYLLNNATDADGDRLEYSLVQPYGYHSAFPPASFLPVPSLVPYAATQYTATTPLGTAAGNYASINSNTGIAKYRTTAPLNSKFVVAIDVKEYRTINGVEQLIGVTRRDLQLVVVSCPNTLAPVLATTASPPIPRAYTVEAGSTLSIPLTATQADGHPLTLSVSSVLLDGPGGYNATFGGNPGTIVPGNPAGMAATPSTASPVAGTFVYTAGCNDARATPYDVTLTAKDDGCSGKTVGDVLRITVVKPTGPTAIAGNLTVCGLNTVQSYTASGGTTPTVSWTVTGGTIVGSSTANPVQVSWPTAGTGTVAVQGLTQNGCPMGQLTKTVTISPASPLAVTGSQTICQGSSTTLTVTGGTAPYTLTGGATPVSGAGPFVLSPTQTTTYTILSAAAGTACSAAGQATITVNPLPVANAGAAVAFCSGGMAQLGTASVAGNTYSWSPATGLSSATVANPTVTLTNTTGTPVTQTYTLTVTGAGTCAATATVAVTVNPQLVATAGNPVGFCSGGTAQLGTPAVAGNTYSWSPATGLSSASIANPTVTLLNTTAVPITQTYTLTVSGAGSCLSTSTVIVTVNPKPVANAGGAVAFCSGNSAALGTTPVAGNTYSWSPATGLSSATVANPAVTLTNTTGAPITQTYTLTVTNAASCTGTSAVVVTVNPQPVANAGAAVAFCSGGTAQLGAAPVSGLTYSWTPATGLSNPAVANPTVTLPNTTGGALTQTYTLTVTGAGNCSATSTVAVTVNPMPTVTAGATVSFCSGGTAQLGAPAAAGLAYSWSPATGLSNANLANPTVTLTNPTGAPITQTYTLTASSVGTSCVITSTVVVTVQPKPVADAGAAVSICSGGMAQLGAAAVAGNTYSWSPATGLSSPTIANPTVTLTNTTGAPITQTYTLTVTSAANCTNTGTVAVTVNSPSVVSAGAPVAFCSGETAQLGTTGVAGNTYSWSPTMGLSSSTVANPTVTLTNTTGAAITQTYMLTVANTNTGCLSTATVAVTVHSLPVAAVGPAVAFCSGGTAQLGAAPVAGVGYSWSPATGLSSSTVANPSVSLTNATGAPITQTYTLTATNAATSCVSSKTVIVTVNPLPVAVPGPDLTLCSGATGQLGAAPLAGNTYSWSPATGLSSATVANPTVTLPNATAAATTQTYTLTVTNAATACTTTGTVAVTVAPAVVPGTIGADQTLCAGSVPAPLTSLAAASGGLGPYAYQWESSADNSNWKAIANATSLGYAPGALAATTYFRRQVAVGACGVAYTNAVKVHVQPLLVPGVALPTLPAQCAGTAFTYSPVPANAGAAPTYRWFVNNTLVGTSTVFTSTALADGDIVQVELTPTVGFCATGTATATTRVSLTPVPPPTLAIATQAVFPVCEGAPVSFTLSQATNLGSNPQYQWQADGVAISGATKATLTSTTLRDGQVITLVLRTTNACGQPATATSSAVRVAVTPPVHVSAGPDKTITEGESVTLEGTANGSYPVTWTPSATLTFAGPDQLRPVAAPLATTTYTLSAGAGSCADQSSVTVTVLKRVRIPSAFTPNADNNDDTWQIANIEEYPNNHVQVFNRWGSKLFDATGYSRSNEWNGTYNGEPLPLGTYYYLVTLGNGKSYSGPITVLH